MLLYYILPEMATTETDELWTIHQWHLLGLMQCSYLDRRESRGRQSQWGTYCLSLLESQKGQQACLKPHYLQRVEALGTPGILSPTEAELKMVFGFEAGLDPSTSPDSSLSCLTFRCLSCSLLSWACCCCCKRSPLFAHQGTEEILKESLPSCYKHRAIQYQHSELCYLSFNQRLVIPLTMTFNYSIREVKR